MIQKVQLQSLEKSLTGELFFDDLHKNIYATDASVYRKIPLAVAYPKNKKDIQNTGDLHQSCTYVKEILSEQ